MLSWTVKLPAKDIVSCFPGEVVGFNFPSQLLVRLQMNVNIQKVVENPTAGVAGMMENISEES